MQGLGFGNDLSGANQATATANITVNAGGAAGGNLAISVNDLQVRGGEASAYAKHHVNSGSNHVLAGNNTVSAQTQMSFSAPNSSLTIDLGEGGDMTVWAGSAYTSAYKSVSNGNFHSLSGDNAATANSAIRFTAGQALTIDDAGSLTVQEWSSDAPARGSAYQYVSGGFGNTLSGNNTADSTLEVIFSAGTDLTVSATGRFLASAYSAAAKAYHQADGGEGNMLGGNNSATANAVLRFSAGAELSITAGSMEVNGDDATAKAYKEANSFGSGHTLSGTNTAAADTRTTLTGGTVTINLGSGSLEVYNGSASAYAYHDVNSGSAHNLSGDHNATANAATSITATGGALTINAGSFYASQSGDATASAYKYVSSGNNNTLSGANTATANNSITLSGTSVAISLGTGSFSISASSAEAEAYHYVSNGTGNNLSGDHVATANSNITLAATGGALTINAGYVEISGDDASATAYKYVSGSTNTLSGANTASANSNISLSGTSLTLNLGSGSLFIYGSDAEAYAYHQTGGSNNSNNMSGNHVATANSNITLTATGALTINATGGVEIYGSSASASAYKYVNGNTNTVSGGNTATANSNITLSGTSVTLNLGAGSLYISGSSAEAEAYHYISSDGNILSGVHVANANSNITLAATGGDLTINAGSLTVYGSSASASGYMNVSGNNNTVGVAGTASNTASADATIRFTAAGNLAIVLGSGSMDASASISASASAYHYATGTANTLNGNNTAAANTGVMFSAGNALTIQAGSLNLGDIDASADAYKQVCCAGADGNQLTGNNSATGNAVISFLAGGPMNISLAGGLSIFGSYTSATARNMIFSGNNNTLSGSNTANALANISFRASDLTIQAGGVSLAASSADADASNNINGAGNVVSGANTALVQSNITLSGTNSVTIDPVGSMSVRASSAQASASNFVTGVNTVTAANTASAHSDVLVASGGDLTINVTGGNLTVQGDTARASTSGGGANTATANANAGIFALGTKAITVSGNVNLTGGSIFASGAGATANAYAMLDPGELNLMANEVVITPNTGQVILSASGPMNVSTIVPDGFVVDGVPGAFSSFTGAPGVIFGPSAVTTADPLIVSVSDTPLNLTELFSLPPGFLAAVVTPVVEGAINPCVLAPEICAPPKSFEERSEQFEEASAGEDKEKDKEKKKEEEIEKGLNAECS